MSDVGRVLVLPAPPPPPPTAIALTLVDAIADYIASGRAALALAPLAALRALLVAHGEAAERPSSPMPGTSAKGEPGTGRSRGMAG